jgi:hypothetical protein
MIYDDLWWFMYGLYMVMYGLCVQATFLCVLFCLPFLSCLYCAFILCTAFCPECDLMRILAYLLML